MVLVSRKANEQRNRKVVPVAALVAAGLSLAAPAWAGERPDTWDMSLPELQAMGLGQSRGEPVPVPPDAPRLGATQGSMGAKQGRIFVNFDGAQLTQGWDDSRNNTTQISNLAGNFAPYGDGPKRDAVMQAVRQDWAEYDVIITDERPASGDYTMNMIGPTNPFGGGVLGIAPLDCNDSQTHNNITYAFHSANDSFSAAVQATTVGQEVAHSYGLEHVDEPGDIMNPYNAGGDASFIDACIPIVSNQGIACGSQHQVNCGSPSAQNAHLELLDLFGAATPDTTAPTVSIVQPQDGDVFEAGASFEIEAEAVDDNAIEVLQLYNNGEALQTDGSEPYGWSVSNIPEGEYELLVVARDVAGNESMSNVVTIVVGDAAGGDGGGGSESDGGGTDGAGGDDSDGGTDGGAGDGGDAGGSDTDAALPEFGNEDADSGCGCQTGAPTPGSTWLLGLLGLALIRRRRS